MADAETALLLARIQFAFTISFHFIFPAFSIGLASYLAVLEGLWLKTGETRYLNLFQYWLKIFALAFAMGVVSGIVMSYQFGTNWSVFSDRAGPMIGPLMAYEVLTAFFLEAGFLGVMLFGMDRVGKGLHFAATLMVAIGTFISAFWILSVNSWMQTPTGWALNDAGPVRAGGQLARHHLQSQLPLSPRPHRARRLSHHRARRRRGRRLASAEGPQDTPRSGRCSRWRCGWLALVAPVQIFVGDQHGLNTLRAPAGEDHGDGGPFPEPSRRRAADICSAFPTRRRRRCAIAIAIPKLGSLLLEHDLNAPMRRARHGAAGGPAAGRDHLLVVPDHGRARLPDVRARPAEPARALAEAALRLDAGCTASRWSWARPASSR